MASLETDITNNDRQIGSNPRQITPEIGEQAAGVIQRYLQTGDIAFRKDSVGMRIDQVILMSDVVRISGSRTDLASVIGD